MLSAMTNIGVSYKTLLPCVLAVTLLYLDTFSCHYYEPAGCMQDCRGCRHSLILAELQPLPMFVTTEKRLISQCSGQKKKKKKG